MLPEKPFRLVSVIVDVAEDPGVADRADGVAIMLKSSGIVFTNTSMIQEFDTTPLDPWKRTV
jgi:hypothetical protein